MNSIILPNSTEIKPKSNIKWLEIWLNRKLNFKKHVETRINNVTKALYQISSLMKSEWGLSANAARQLYLACIVSISDYDLELWVSNQVQKSYINMFQKLQNKAIRKILKAFKTSLIQFMKIEVNILLAQIRLLQKNQKYVVRISGLDF